MEVILLERVHKLGGLGDKVVVKPGFARNFLIPKGKATRATKANLEKFESMREVLEKKERDSLAAAQTRAAKINGLVITITANAGAEGKLYGSVGPVEIADAILAVGADIEKKEIRLTEGPIRHTGEYELAIHLHPEVDANVSLRIVSETGEIYSEEDIERDSDEDFEESEYSDS